MLTRLSVRDIVLIDRLDIDFAPGLSVLTRETGTGKSILLDAFALSLGARGDASLVRRSRMPSVCDWHGSAVACRRSV
jgi:DNA repair protein RecN (Recombination protein N)